MERIQRNTNPLKLFNCNKNRRKSTIIDANTWIKPTIHISTEALRFCVIFIKTRKR